MSMAPRLCAMILTGLALAIFLSDGLFRALTGTHPLRAPEVAGLDQGQTFEQRDASDFFRNRDSVEVTVPREMPVDAFLSLYRVRRAQIREKGEPGGGALKPGDLLKPGRVYVVHLTPKPEEAR